MRIYGLFVCFHLGGVYAETRRAGARNSTGRGPAGPELGCGGAAQPAVMYVGIEVSEVAPNAFSPGQEAHWSIPTARTGAPPGPGAEASSARCPPDPRVRGD